MSRRQAPKDQDSGGSGRSYAVLRHRDYRILFIATIVLSLGSQVQRTAITWHVFELTGDPLQLGYIGLARFFPLLIFGLAGGVLADRGDRRKTLLMTQVVLLGSSAALAAMTWSGEINVLLIYALTALTATVTAIANPTRQAFIPSLVPRSELSGAMSLNILGSK